MGTVGERTVPGDVLVVGDPVSAGVGTCGRLLVGEEEGHDEVAEKEAVHAPVEHEPDDARVVPEEAHLTWVSENGDEEQVGAGGRG